MNRENRRLVTLEAGISASEEIVKAYSFLNVFMGMDACQEHVNVPGECLHDVGILPLPPSFDFTSCIWSFALSRQGLSVSP